MAFKAMTDAEEFAKYMATAAENYAKEVQALFFAEAERIEDGDSLQDRHIAVHDKYIALKSAIYEFRKRIPKEKP